MMTNIARLPCFYGAYNAAMFRFCLALLIGACAVNAGAADEPWFKLVEAKGGGYVAGGKLHGASWGFRLPGREIKAMSKPGELPMLMVDGVFLSLVPVGPEAYGRSAANPLEAQKKYEQDHFRKVFPGVKLGEHDFCKGATQPHTAWIAELPANVVDQPGPTPLKNVQRLPFTVVVTFQVADVVLMMTSAYGDEPSRKATAAKIDAICRTFVSG
jgi:hypothetical protein